MMSNNAKSDGKLQCCMRVLEADVILGNKVYSIYHDSRYLIQNCDNIDPSNAFCDTDKQSQLDIL